MKQNSKQPLLSHDTYEISITCFFLLRNAFCFLVSWSFVSILLCSDSCRIAWIQNSKSLSHKVKKPRNRQNVQQILKCSRVRNHRDALSVAGNSESC